MTVIDIVEVTTGKQLNQFVDFPHQLYKGDPNYVPEIKLAVKDLLNKKKNPYFEHSDASLYLAYSSGKVVGRIAATINNNYNKFHRSNVGFFGFFDCINDQDVANALLTTAENYCRRHNADTMLGPTNLTTNDTAGILVEGFDSPPVVQMTYNYSYYPRLLENFGLVKEMDLLAYKLETSTVNTKSLKLASILKQRLLEKRGVTFRKIDLKNFKDEIRKIKDVYLKAWEKNWGFVPPTDREFTYLAEGLKLIIDDRFGYVAEQNGRIVAFALALPNINEILINIKNGRLFPLGIFKLLFGKRKVKSVRIILLGVIPEFRKQGIEAVFFADFIESARNFGKDYGEASWVLESNQAMVQAAVNLNGVSYKRYRIYGKALSR